MRILLAEDDKSLGSLICNALHKEGNAVDWVEDGQAALRSHPGAHSAQPPRWRVDSPLPELESLAWLEAPVLPGEWPPWPDEASAFLSDPRTGLGELGAPVASLRMKQESAEASPSR